MCKMRRLSSAATRACEWASTAQPGVLEMRVPKPWKKAADYEKGACVIRAHNIFSEDVMMKARDLLPQLKLDRDPDRFLLLNIYH